MKLRYVLCITLMLISGEALAYHCEISSTPLTFGSIEGVAGKERQTTATLTVVCRNEDTPANVEYKIIIDSQNINSEHEMTSGSHSNFFNTYKTENYQEIWGNSTPNIVSDSYSIAANDTVSRTYTVYAKMKTGRDAPPGIYIANMIVRLLY